MSHSLTDPLPPHAISPIKVTLDTNVLISGLDGEARKKAAFRQLLDLHQQGAIELAMSSRLAKDKENDRDKERARRDLQVAGQFPVIPGPFRLDVSRLGEDLIVDGDMADALTRIIRPPAYRSATRNNTLWDIDHLYAHWAARRDLFLTWESRILNRADSLAEFGIRVASPDAFLGQLRANRWPT